MAANWISWISKRWLTLFIVVFGAFILTPFLAPVFMKIGATGPARVIYAWYSLFCHQLPQRSLFLFGPKLMYSLAEIEAVWPIEGFLGLRQFVGNAEMGYKVAWSDRMVALYGSLWLGAIIHGLGRRWLKPLPPVAWFTFGFLPLALDGFSHVINDLVAGTGGAGFRDTNAWLQALTGNRLPTWFYVGDALGSFNSDMRWLTGILFGLCTAWLLFPLMDGALHRPSEPPRPQYKPTKKRGPAPFPMRNPASSN